MDGDEEGITCSHVSKMVTIAVEVWDVLKDRVL